jgi:hypothetical protein
VKKLSLYFVIFVMMATLASCTGPDSSPRALLNVILVDTPAKWDSVFVEIEGVEVNMLVQGRETSPESFFFEYKNGDKKIKVSDLVGGNALLLGRSELPLGQVTEVTVRLGNSHSMFFGQNEYPLPLVDPVFTELVLSTLVVLEQGISYDLYLDMDLEKSIEETSIEPLSYQLNPTFTLIKGAETGELKGLLSNQKLYPAAFLFNSSDTLSTHLNSSGTYYFRAPAGEYTVRLDPKDERYLDTTFSVQIEPRKITVIEKKIAFRAKP